MYTANTGSNDASAFSINFDGSLTTVVGSPFPVGTLTVPITASSHNKIIVIAAGAGAFVYTMDKSGALHPVISSPFAAGVGANGVSIDPADKFVYRKRWIRLRLINSRMETSQ